VNRIGEAIALSWVTLTTVSLVCAAFRTGRTKGEGGF
jgi:hypothetical protein